MLIKYEPEYFDTATEAKTRLHELEQYFYGYSGSGIVEFNVELEKYELNFHRFDSLGD